jgi:hypothetical protein
MPSLAIKFLKGAFPLDEPLAFIEYKYVASLLKQVGTSIKDDMMADTYR